MIISAESCSAEIFRQTISARGNWCGSEGGFIQEISGALAMVGSYHAVNCIVHRGWLASWVQAISTLSGSQYQLRTAFLYNMCEQYKSVALYAYPDLKIVDKKSIHDR